MTRPLREAIYKIVCAHRNSTTPDQFTDMLMAALPQTEALKLAYKDGFEDAKDAHYASRDVEWEEAFVQSETAKRQALALPQTEVSDALQENTKLTDEQDDCPVCHLPRYHRNLWQDGKGATISFNEKGKKLFELGREAADKLPALQRRYEQTRQSWGKSEAQVRTLKEKFEALALPVDNTSGDSDG